MLSMVFRNSTSDKKYSSKFFEKILETAIREIKKLRNKETKKLGRISMSVNLVGEVRIKELNRKYRKKNKPTDVLSFPILEKPTALDIGDIFICLSIAKSEAKRENITIKQKLAQLVVHGFLHLQGYEHEKSEKDAKKMFLLEKKILSNN